MSDIIIASLKEENEMLKDCLLGALRIIEKFDSSFDEIGDRLGVDNTERSKHVRDYIKETKERFGL